MEPFSQTSNVLKPGTYSGTPNPTPGNTTPAVRIIHTMKSDIAEVIAKQNETATSIALAEAKKREWERATTLAAKQDEAAIAISAKPIAKPRGRFFIILMMFLLAVVSGVLAYKVFASKPTIISLPLIGYVNFGKSTTEKPIVVEATKPAPLLATAFITAQSEKRFALNKETSDHILAVIAVERTSGLAAGTIKNFFFTEEPILSGGGSPSDEISASRLFAFMRAQVPDLLLRSIDAPFMLGLYGNDASVASPFLILKTSDVDASRAAMLTWETSLARSFDSLFGTKIESQAPSKTVFHDTIIAGKDARVFGSELDSALVYAFADSHTIVIAASPAALQAALSQLPK